MISTIHHIGCLVPDIEAAIEDYLILYPAGKLSELFEIQEQKVLVRFFEINGMHIEFVQPINEQSTLYRQLKKNPGYYHIGIFTDDIDTEIARLEEAGYRKLNKFTSPAFGNRYCAFMYNLEMHLVELIEN